jgi:hypothetical protein
VAFFIAVTAGYFVVPSLTVILAADFETAISAVTARGPRLGNTGVKEWLSCGHNGGLRQISFKNIVYLDIIQEKPVVCSKKNVGNLHRCLLDG